MMVIAITLTPVRHKRHMQFLTSVPFGGGGSQLTFPLTRCNGIAGTGRVEGEEGIPLDLGLEIHDLDAVCSRHEDAVRLTDSRLTI